MVLSDIKHYLQERRQASLRDLANHFDTEPGAMRGMLEPWIHKGRVVRCGQAGSCGRGCGGCHCDQAAAELYQWQA
jgi:predicted ArsR family transcriptional regulator